MIGDFDAVRLFNEFEARHITTFALALPPDFDFEGLVESLKGVDIIPDNDYGWRIISRDTEIVVINKFPEQRVFDTILGEVLPCRRRIILIKGNRIRSELKALFTIRQIPLYKLTPPTLKGDNDYAKALPHYVQREENDWFGKLFFEIIKDLIIKILSEYI